MSTMSATYRLPATVLQEICRELLCLPLDQTDQGYRHIGSRTVAALAVTARLFLEPALNVLWHTIPDIAILFFTLDEEAYYQGSVIEGERQFRFKGTPRESQLERFFAYARRVRAIYSAAHVSTRARHINASPAAYDTLAGILGGTRTLLPNVEKIYYQRPETMSLAFFRSFHIMFSPKLWALHICSFLRSNLSGNAKRPTRTEQQAFVQMLHKLADIKPRLQGLYIWTDLNSSATMAASVASAVCVFDHLISLQLPNCSALLLDPAAFGHLARLPGLRELDCELGRSEGWADLAASLAQHPSFPALRNLGLTTPTFALSTTLLRFVESPYLTELMINGEHDTPRDELDPLLAAIAGLRSAKTIKKLCVTASIVPSSTVTGAARLSSTKRKPPPRPIDRATLEPLFTMPWLYEVVLDIICLFDVDDALLEACATAWPALNVLKLGFDDPWGLLAEGDFTDNNWHVADGGTSQHADPGRIVREVLPPGTRNADSADVWRKPRATLFGLIALTRRCPELRVLLVELDASLKAVPPALLEARPSGPRGAPMPVRINRLDVGLSPIEDPYAVAAFLSDWMSDMDSLRSGWIDLMDGNGDDADDEDGEDEDTTNGDLGWPSIARIYHKRWRMVERLIPLFARVRMQERHWKWKTDGPPMCVPRENEIPMDFYDELDDFWTGIHW